MSLLYMNYSCIPAVNYFDSPGFLSLTLHTNTAISTPIHLFGFYCILFKTTDQMKSAKWYLVNLHVWAVAFDYSFSILTIPFLLIPSFAGYPLGILRYFGVSTLFQIIMVLVFLSNMCVSIVFVFENRFHAICEYPGREHWARWRRVWIVFFYFLGASSFFYMTFITPDQEIAKRNMFQKLPCLPDYVYKENNYVLAEDITYHLLVFVVFIFTTTLKVFIFVAALVFNSVQQLKRKTMSQKTFQLHKTFITALLTQVSVPLIMFIFPSIYAWIAVVHYYYNQGMTNVGATMLSMHGFLSSIVMILVHRPYRNALFDLFRKRAPLSEGNSKRWFQYHRNVSVGPAVE